eukprot:TRINITY_DN32495_c0_g1_i3.p1 TRINITY_DN32495_c0_g1~~TRINITY_DN32495_c0_g1_i3.p1  ORF type:complete len:535 (+),score=99.14 TRINITY_DN32495_c0_g1_i3:182-1786(+)
MAVAYAAPAGSPMTHLVVAGPAQVAMSPRVSVPWVAQVPVQHAVTVAAPIAAAPQQAPLVAVPVSPPPPVVPPPGGAAGGPNTQDGRFTDPEFPPNTQAIFGGANPGAQEVQELLVETQGGHAVWRRVSEFAPALFENVHPNDLAQGRSHDDVLLAALACLAEFPDSVPELFKEQELNPGGYYHVKIFDSNTGQWNWVTVDDWIPFGADGQPLCSKPRDLEAWVLLLEKAWAKWFGSYARLMAGGASFVPLTLLTNSASVKVYSQPQLGLYTFDVSQFRVDELALRDVHDRTTLTCMPKAVAVPSDQAFEELQACDVSNYLMLAWTKKDPVVQAVEDMHEDVNIAADGLVKGRVYAILGVDRFEADGRLWRIVTLRNPWSSDKRMEWKGDLCDSWPGWPQFPQLRHALAVDRFDTDGQFFLPWERFVERFSDVGVMRLQGRPERYGRIETAVARGTRVTGVGVTEPANRIGKPKMFRKPPGAPAPPSPPPRLTTATPAEEMYPEHLDSSNAKKMKSSKRKKEKEPPPSRSWCCC